MSVKAMGRVWEMDLHPNFLLILLALADHADHNGCNAYPSQALLAWKTGYSVRNVRKVLRELRDAGIIEAQSAQAGVTVRYRIVFDAVPAKTGYVSDDTESPPVALVREEEPEAELPLKEEASDVPAGWTPEEYEVFKHWAAVRDAALGREKADAVRVQPTRTRRSKIGARLKEGYSVAALKKAVDGCFRSTFHVEHGHLDIELICRDQRHVEMFLGHSRRPKEPEAPPEPGTPEWAARERRRITGT